LIAGSIQCQIYIFVRTSTLPSLFCLSCHLFLIMSSSSSAPTSPVSKPAYLRKRSRSFSLEHTPKPYKRCIHDPDNWYRLFTSFNDRSDSKQCLKDWGKANAPGVGYESLRKRYNSWTEAGQPKAPPPLPPRIQNKRNHHHRKSIIQQLNHIRNPREHMILNGQQRRRIQKKITWR